MNTFALDKNYNQFNFEEISVDDLEIISGGTGVANVNDGLASNYYSSTYGWTLTIEGQHTQTSYNTQYYSYSYTTSSGQYVTGTGSGNFA